MYKTGLRIICALVVAVFLVACAQTVQLTTKDKATWVMAIYTAQYDDYKDMVKRPGLTTEQKQALKYKKEALTKLEPLIKTYITIVDANGKPPADLDKQLTTLINDLVYGR